MSATATALWVLVGWWLLLIVALAAFRTLLTFGGSKQANQFAPDGSDVGGFGQRLTRAHANNYENLPMFGVILLYAIATGQTAVTDGLAGWLAGARVAQSVTHLASISVPAVTVRFAFYLVQLVIVGIWLFRFVG